MIFTLFALFQCPTLKAPIELNKNRDFCWWAKVASSDYHVNPRKALSRFFLSALGSSGVTGGYVVVH